MGFNLRNRELQGCWTSRRVRSATSSTCRADLKAAKYGGYEQPRLKGKNIALIFEKASTRTRVRVRGGGLRPGRPRHLPRPERVADRSQGVDEGHRPRPGPDLRRRSSTAASARRWSRAGPVRRRAGLERPDRRVPPHPDPGRRPDDDRAERQAARQISYCYLGDARNNMGDSLHGRRQQAGHGRAPVRAQAPLAGRGTGESAARSRRRPAPGSRSPTTSTRA